LSTTICHDLRIGTPPLVKKRLLHAEVLSDPPEISPGFNSCLCRCTDDISQAVVLQRTW